MQCSLKVSLSFLTLCMCVCKYISVFIKIYSLLCRSSRNKIRNYSTVNQTLEGGLLSQIREN